MSEQVLDQPTQEAQETPKQGPPTPEQLATSFGELGFDTSRAFRNIIPFANNVGLLKTKEEIAQYRETFGNISLNLTRSIVTALEMRRMIDIVLGEIRGNEIAIEKENETLVKLA